MITVDPAKIMHIWYAGNVGAGWKSFWNDYPPDPDKIVVFQKTGGLIDTHSMATGKRTIHPGIQVRVRDFNPTDAFLKIATVLNLMEAIKYDTVTVDSVQYRLWAFDVITDIIPMGFENQNRRYSYVFNGNLTLSGV